jgi:uncharacterized membrane protein
MLKRLFFRAIATLLYKSFPNQRKWICYVLLTIGVLELAIGIPIIFLFDEEALKKGWGAVSGILAITGLFAVFTGMSLQKLVKEQE